MVPIPSISNSLIPFALFSSTQAATCIVQTGGAAAVAVAKAFNDCKNGGTVVFSKGATYNANSLIDIKDLNNVNVQFYGTLNLPSYNTKYNGGSAFFRVRGNNIHWDGAGVGTINGGGQVWWDAQNNQAPTVFRMTATHSVFRNFKINAASRAHLALTSCDDVVLEKVTLYTVSKNNNIPKSTDALDISSSSNLIFRDSNLTVGDDCTAIKGGVSNVTLSNINCVGGHGFSVGSLGKGGSTEYVKQVRVIDSVCTNCQNGVRIKTWDGGKGAVSDIRFERVKLINAENPVIITTHYCDKNQMSYCQENNHKPLTISNVIIKDITGSTSSKDLPAVSITCSSGTRCSGFSLSNINVTKHSKTKPNVYTYLNGLTRSLTVRNKSI